MQENAQGEIGDIRNAHAWERLRLQTVLLFIVIYVYTSSSLGSLSEKCHFLDPLRAVRFPQSWSHAQNRETGQLKQSLSLKWSVMELTVLWLKFWGKHFCMVSNHKHSHSPSQTILACRNGCPRRPQKKQTNYEMRCLPINTEQSSFWATAVHGVICCVVHSVNIILTGKVQIPQASLKNEETLCWTQSLTVQLG